MIMKMLSWMDVYSIGDFFFETKKEKKGYPV